MEEIIMKIQKEVDDSNRREEAKLAKLAPPKDEFEFNKEKMLEVSFPNLENAMKYLLREVGKLTGAVDKMQKDIKSRSYTVDKMFKEGTERDEKVKEIQTKLRDLENKSVDFENKSFEFNTNFESFKMNYQIQTRSVSGLQDRVGELEDFHEAEEPKWKDIQALLNDGAVAPTSQAQASPTGDFINTSEFQKLVDRMNSNDVLIDSFISKVNKLSKNVNEKSEKLKTPAFNESDDIEARLKNLERMVNKLGDSVHSGHKVAGGSHATHIEANIENRVKHIEKDLEDFKSSVPVNTVGSNDETTHSSISYNLKKRMDSMVKDHQELKNGVITCQNMMNNKVDLEQLQEIDKVVTDKLNDCIKAVKRQMHDKSESTRNLKRLERQLRSLYDVLYSQVGASDEEEDPLMAKSKMYNMSPYDKKMAMNNSMGKYPVWKKLPPTSKSRKRSRHTKDVNRMVGNPKNDPRAMKYYNVMPGSMHNTQPDFYDAQESKFFTH